MDRCGGVNWQAGSEYPGTAGKTHANNFINYMFYVHICILLVKTISMICICCKKHGRKGLVCVLTVGDNELDVGGNKVTSFSSFGGCRGRGHVREGMRGGSRTERNTWESVPELRRVETAGYAWIREFPGTPVDLQAESANIGL